MPAEQTTDWRGRLASWPAMLWAGGEPVEILRYGALERVDRDGTAHVRMMRAYDPGTPPEDEGKVIMLQRGQWRIAEGR